MKAFAIATMILIVNCSQPVQNEFPDKIELVSVWQFLKVFSIYSDSSYFPKDPFAFKSSQQLFDYIADTLKGNYYTGYSDSFGGTIRYGSSGYANLTGKVVKLDTLTDSCCLLTITTLLNTEGNVLEQFHAAVSKIGSFSNIIIDVRHNGGGNLTITDSIIQCILPMGTKYIHAKERIYNQYTKKATTVEHDWSTSQYIQQQLPAFKNKKFAVLIDRYSASASEILALALKDGAGAVLIGEKSYGKAIGQVHLNRRNRPILKITYLHLYRIGPSPFDYHRIGVTPDEVASQLITEAAVLRIPEVNKPVYYAIKTLQPSATIDSIRFPSAINNLSAPPVLERGLYKDIDESDVDLQ